MILEFAQGGELFNLLEQENIFDEEWASFYLAVSNFLFDFFNPFKTDLKSQQSS